MNNVNMKAKVMEKNYNELIQDLLLAAHIMNIPQELFIEVLEFKKELDSKNSYCD